MTAIGWNVCAGALFAALWGLWGGSALPPTWRRRVAVIVLMASAGVAARAVLDDAGVHDSAPGFTPSVYLAALVLASVGVATALRLLRRPSRVGWRPPVIAAIVGLHVLGLWAATGLRLFVGVALGMTASSLIAAGWPRRAGGVDPRLAITGLGCALVLWGGCLAALASGPGVESGALRCH